MGFVQEHQIKAICYDIDGTFYPKWKMHVRLVWASIFNLRFALRYNELRRKIRKEDGKQDLPPLSYDEIGKRGAKFIYNDDSPSSTKKFRKEEGKVFHNSFDRTYMKIKPSEGVIDALKAAKREGMRMAALSDFPLGIKLRALGIEKYFEFAISSEDIGRFKPAKTPFIVMQDMLELRPEEILYVGDSYEKDIQGAKNAGMYTCLIFSKKKKSYSEVDVFAKNWEEFKNLVIE